MTLRFNVNDRAFAPDLNNAALQLTYSVITNSNVTENTVPDMNVKVLAGAILFNGVSVNVGAQTIAVTTAHPSLDRMDVVLIDGSGIATVLAGTPGTTPKTTTYDPSLYVPVARIFVDDGVTSIVNAKITDIRVINPVNTGGGGLDKYTASFTSITNQNFTHSLNDAQVVVQVYDSLNEQITPDVIDIIDANTVNLQFSLATSGFVTIQGGVFSPTVLTSNLVSTGFVNQTTVNYNHGLNMLHPFIQVYDNTNQIIEPATITAVDANNITVTFGSSTTGTIIVTGNAKVPADGIGKYSTSFSGVTTLTVTHNLNDLYPDVTVYDNTGLKIFPDVTLLNANSLTLDFSSSTTGNVSVQGGIFSGGTNAGNFLPSLDNLWDIGSGSFRWKDIHQSGSLFLGVLGADPGSPAQGQIWFNSSDSQFKGYNGTSIVILG